MPGRGFRLLFMMRICCVVFDVGLCVVLQTLCCAAIGLWRRKNTAITKRRLALPEYTRTQNNVLSAPPAVRSRRSVNTLNRTDNAAAAFVLRLVYL